MPPEPPSEDHELTEAELAKLRAEVRYAVLAAREIHPQDPPKTGLEKTLAFLSNGFVLLLIGALITSGLVPYFQRVYESRRQQVALMEDCLTQFLLYSNTLWQEYYSILPLSQRVEIDEATYLDYTNKMAQIKLKRYDAYAKVLALSEGFPSKPGTPTVNATLRQYAVTLNQASGSIDLWLTGLYCTPTTRIESPCDSFDASFDAFAEYEKIKAMVVIIGNEGTDNVAAMIVKQANQ